MTDKEKIIDGTDVRKCKHFKALYESRPNGFGGITIENYCYLYEDNCEKYPQCLYRSNQLQQLETQLKRKEQEYEELKEEIDDLKEIIQRHDNDNNALLSECEDDLVDYYRRYKECLTEIKEIAENMNNECFYDDFECKDCDMKNGCTYFNKKQILQKITEVEND